MCVWVLLHVCVCVRAPCGVISCHCLKWMTLKHHSRFFFRHFFLPFFFLTFIHAHIFVFGELEVMLPIYGALKDGVKRGRLRQRQKERKKARERGDTKSTQSLGLPCLWQQGQISKGWSQYNTPFSSHIHLKLVKKQRKGGRKPERKEGRKTERKRKKGQQTHTDTQCHNCQRFCSFFF